jgi:hypothetical protein
LSKTTQSKENAEEARNGIVTIYDAAMQNDTYFICNVSHGQKTHFPKSSHLVH